MIFLQALYKKVLLALLQESKPSKLASQLNYLIINESNAKKIVKNWQFQEIYLWNTP